MAKCHEHQKYQEGKGGISCKEKVGLGRDRSIISLCPLSYVLGLFSMFFQLLSDPARVLEFVDLWFPTLGGSLLIDNKVLLRQNVLVALPEWAP